MRPRIAVTLLIYCAVGNALAEQPRHPATATEDERAAQEQHPAQISRPYSFAEERKPYSTDYETRCQNPENREEADLCQQWRSAEAAEKIVRLSDRQFWITSIEAAALTVSIIFTAWAAIAASRAARAADAAVAITQEMGQRELRAYLHVRRASLRQPVGKAPYIRIWLENTGQTPAKKFRVGCVVRQSTAVDSPEVPRDIEYFEFRAVGGNAKGNVNLSPTGLSAAITNLGAGAAGQRLLFLGRILYTDIFGDEFESEFAYFNIEAPDKEITRLRHPAGMLRSYEQRGGQSRAGQHRPAP